MFKFMNRERELGVLKDFASRPGFQFLPIYGRRRVGKTALIRKFMEKQGGIYFLCRQVAEKVQLTSLAAVVGEYFEDPFVIQRGFGSWDQFFDYLTSRTSQKPEKLVLVFDEYPYLTASTRGISSIFQQAIDEKLGQLNILLILCGSHMGMMEREVLAYPAPLYGRRTGQLQVTPLDYTDVAGFFPGHSPRDQVSLYAVCGGIPAYLEKFDPGLSVRDNLIRNFGREEEFLAQEPEFLLRQELQEVRYYYSIVLSLAKGNRKLGHIVNDTGLDKALIGKYLKVLNDLRIVEREVPVLEANPAKSKKGLYRIQDNLFDFYFRFIFPNRHLLGLEDGNRLYKEKIEPEFDQYVSFKAEEAARSILRREFPQLERIGRQWDRNTEIDLLALDPDDKLHVVAEVKWWKRKKVGLSELRELQAKASNFELDQKKLKYALFSASGFSSPLKREEVLLFDFRI